MYLFVKKLVFNISQTTFMATNAAPKDIFLINHRDELAIINQIKTSVKYSL